MSMFANTRGAFNNLNSQLHTTLNNGPQIGTNDQDYDMLRDEEKRRTIEGACQVLEGSLYQSAFSVLSLLVSCVFLFLGAIFLHESWCQGFFLILAGIFTVNQSHFVVKRSRDSALIPKLDRAMHPSTEYYFLTRMVPHTWHSVFGPCEEADPHFKDKYKPLTVDDPKRPLMCVPKSAKDIMSVPLTQAVLARKLLNGEKVYNQAAKNKKNVQRDAIIIAGINMNIWGGFFFSSVALLVGILLMEGTTSYRSTKFFYILVAIWVSSSSLGNAMTFRDRLAARIYRCYLLEAKKAGDKITTYCMTNILRALSCSESGKVAFLYLMVISLVFTIIALLTPAQGFEPSLLVSRIGTPGFWMVLVCIFFSFVAMHVLASYTQMRKMDEIDTNDDFILGYFGGMIPVMAIFACAIVLAVVGVMTMDLCFTEKAAIITGVIVFIDATFNYYRYSRRVVDAERLFRRWERRYGAGERHMKIDGEEIFGHQIKGMTPLTGGF